MKEEEKTGRQESGTQQMALDRRAMWPNVMTPRSRRCIIAGMKATVAAAASVGEMEAG